MFVGTLVGSFMPFLATTLPRTKKVVIYIMAVFLALATLLLIPIANDRSGEGEREE